MMELPYLAYFNLKEKPFFDRSVTSVSLSHASPFHRLEQGRVCGRNQERYCRRLGDTGMGKSSLARLLHQKFLDRGILSVLITNPNYPGAYSLLRTISQEFRLPRLARSYQEMLSVFKAFLQEQALQNKRTIVLMIDEAQTLRLPLLEVLRQLANVETNQEKLLQIVLFSQQELRGKLAHPRARNFKSRVVMASQPQSTGPY